MRVHFERLWDYLRSKKTKKKTPQARLGVEVLELRCVPAGNASGVISGIAFIDGNANGAFDTGEPLIPGVVVTLSGHTTAQNTPINVTATTNSAGAFNFVNVLPGTYTLKTSPDADLLNSTATIGDIDAPPGVTIVAGQTLSHNVGFETGLAPGAITVASFLTTTGDSPFGVGGAGKGLATYRANSKPTVSSTIADVSAVQGTSGSFDLAAHFTDPDMTNSKVTFNITKNGVKEQVHMILFDTTKPQTVANFFDYIKAGAYNDAFFARETNTATDGIAVLQGGGTKITNGVGPSVIGSLSTIPDELGGTNTNTNGTIAMANTGSPNTASNQFFFNTANNTTLDTKFTVFGQAADPVSQAILDSLGATPTQDLSVQTATVSTATESGATVTITTSAAHKFQVGQTVTIAGVGVGGYNGNYTIVSVPTPTTFTYTDTNLGLASSSGGTAKAGPAFAESSANLFNEVPLTGGAVTDFPTDASKYLVINSIHIDKQDEFLTYDVSIHVNGAADPDLVTKSLTNEMLTLNYKAGAEGTADVTVTATDRFGATVTDTFTVTVTQPNHAPVGTDNTVTTPENMPYTFQQADFGFTDPGDTTFPDTLLAVKITSLPSGGLLTDNGTAVTAGQSVTVADITGNKLVYTPTANQSGAPFANFTFQVQDNGGTAQGGTDTDTTPRTMTINVTHVNQPPVGASNTLNTAVDTPLTLAEGDFGFSDPSDVPLPNTLQAVEITTLPATGTLTLSGNPVAAGDFISLSDITSGNLKFTPGSGATGNPYTTFTFQVQDNGGTANGASDTDATPRTMTINVFGPNTPPSGADNTLTTLENVGHTFAASDFGFSDAGDTPPDSLLAVKITTLPGAGSLTNNGNPVSANDSISVADINAGHLVFTPAANTSGTGYASFTFQVQDDGGTTFGGSDIDASPNTITFDVTHVNQPPIGADNTLNTPQDTPLVFATTDFGFTDPNDTPQNSLLAVKITTLPGAGALTLNGNPVSAGDFVDAADITSGNLVFTPGVGDTGTPYTTFTFQVQDDGGTANSAVDTDVTPRTITINVT